MIKKLAYIFILILLISSCVTSRRVNYLQKLSDSIPAFLSQDSMEYKLMVGDKLYIKISTLDENSIKLFSGGGSSGMDASSDLFSYTILPNGNIKFPYLGNIKIIGLTTRQAKDTIRSKLKTMIPDCDIDVKLVNASFTVIGVAGSGKYNIRAEKLNLFQALALSGDLQPFSDRTKIHILRQNIDGKTQIKTFDIRNKDIINSEFYYIQPNDIIYVQAFSGQFFGIGSFAAVVSTVTSMFSLGYLLYYYSVPYIE